MLARLRKRCRFSLFYGFMEFMDSDAEGRGFELRVALLNFQFMCEIVFEIKLFGRENL